MSLAYAIGRRRDDLAPQTSDLDLPDLRRRDCNHVFHLSGHSHETVRGSGEGEYQPECTTGSQCAIYRLFHHKHRIQLVNGGKPVLLMGTEWERHVYEDQCRPAGF